MTQYIDKAALVAEIEKKRDKAYPNSDWNHGYGTACEKILSFLDTIEVKEVDNMPNIRFPHYKSIVEKVFGAGNLESFEYDEAEQLVSLAKEELLKDLEVKEVNLEEKATQLSQKYFPDEGNIWARPNIEAHNCKSACIEMVEWFKAQKGE